MGEDRRFGWPNIRAIERLREQRKWSLEDLADAAKSVSFVTIRRIENRENLKKRQRRVFRALASAFAVDAEDLYFKSFEEAQKALNGYTWKDIEVGAKKVANDLVRLVKEDWAKGTVVRGTAEKVDQRIGDWKPTFDAVLTFPAASSIFCGMVMRHLPSHQSLRIPVYTAFFGREAGELGESRKKYFFTVSCDLFTIFVPRELIESGLKRIVVIEDSIITGRAMERLKGFFSKNPEHPVLKFACCIFCRSPRDHVSWLRPEIVGIDPIEKEKRFELPWGEAYSYEDVFEQRH